MSAESKIEWTDKTWNPVRGCSVISPGCVNCYAMKQAHRFSGPGKAYDGLTKLAKAGPQWTGAIRTVESALLEPLSWRKPQRVFVNSMSDLFHEGVPDEFIDKVFAVMWLAHWHTFQILTKRAGRMAAYMNDAERQERWYYRCERMNQSLPERLLERIHTSDGAFAAIVDNREQYRSPLFLKNVWLGVSVEDQKHADERIPQLLQTPAAVRFISAEPLLGPLNLNTCGTTPYMEDRGCLPDGRGTSLDWVIVGGESGPGARPFALAWARSILQQCQSAGVPVFVKQVGAVPIAYTLGPVNPVNGRTVGAIKDRKGGDIDEFPVDLRVRQFPEARQ